MHERAESNKRRKPSSLRPFLLPLAFLLLPSSEHSFAFVGASKYLRAKSAGECRRISEEQTVCVAVRGRQWSLRIIRRLC
jgi:hypothetical protein